MFAPLQFLAIVVCRLFLMRGPLLPSFASFVAAATEKSTNENMKMKICHVPREKFRDDATLEQLLSSVKLF